MESCSVHVTFEDVLLGEPTIVKLKCDKRSRLFPYYLRKAIHDIKRIPPYEQELNKISDSNNNELMSYGLKIRKRNEINLFALTIHGHHMDEYHLQIDSKDRVIDIKFLLSPLVNNGDNAEDIQLNYNTLRRLEDNEIMYDTNCLSPSIRIMFWFEKINKNDILNINETRIYQSVSKLLTINPLYPDVGTTLRNICKKYRNDTKKYETFGFREYLDKNDISKRGNYKYINYNIISLRIDYISCAFKYILNLSNKSMIGLCSDNRRDWLLCDYACSVSSIISVPLYPTLDKNALEYITNHAKLDCIVTDYKTLNDITLLLPKCKSLKYIILMDDELADQLYIDSKEGSRILNKYSKIIKRLSHLEEAAKNGINNEKYIIKDNIANPDDLYSIMYTSGTTGNPKGVMLTHRNVMSFANAFLTVDTSEKHPLPNGAERVHLSYLPLAHIMERIIDLMTLIRGAKIGFWRGDREGLIEDMNIIKPPVFAAVPRIYQRIQDMILNKMNEKPAIIRWLFNYAYNKKLNAIKLRQQPSAILDRIIFKKINDAFGGNIIYIGSGSAPLSRETAEFLKVCLAKYIQEGYGLTETCGGGTGTHEFDLKYGHVGQPRANIKIKLVSVAEMNYLVTDKPNPRGQILMKGACVFKGYYKNRELTKEVLSGDGWFATGDIGEWRKEGKLEIIDRKKNIFKLSQGEYIRPEYIQNIYKLSRYITNCFVYGNSLKNYLVAIIVPDFEALQQIGFTENDIDKIELIEIIRNELKLQEENAKLNGFEKVKKFKLMKQEFSTENGLLTITMKLKRNVARKRFEKEINDLYKIKSKL